ncbi:hypothetical protein GCM10028833_04490 [Glycomyces tarimensis]
MPGDRFGVDDCGGLLEAQAGLGVLEQQRSDGVGDLPLPAVADREVHPHAPLLGGALLGVLEAGLVLRWEEVERADHAQLPRLLGLGQLAGELADDVEQRVELLLRPREVLGGQQPDRDVLDAELFAPAEEPLNVLRPGAVAIVRIGEPHVARPPAVPVDQDADVLGQRLARQLTVEPTFIDAVEQVCDRHERQL